MEITAYSLLTLLKAQQKSPCSPILKWLLSQRNSQGGFEGTQDTIVGIEALAEFATSITTKDTNISINVQNSADKNEQNFKISNDNSLVMHTEKLPSNAKNVNVTATGSGFALLEVSYRYNIKEVDPVPAFVLKVKPTLENNNRLTLDIDTR